MQNVHIAQVEVSGRGSSGAQVSHGIRRLPSDAGASAEQGELWTNSPRSEDLCKLSGLLHCRRSVFFFALSPEAYSCRSSKFYRFFHLILCCCEGQSECVTFQMVACCSLGESLVICASRSAGGEVLCSLLRWIFVMPFVCRERGVAFSEMGGNNVKGAQSKKYRMDLDADISSWLLPRLVRDQ